MALSTPFVGSGEFVPVRVWSCPVHDDDVTYRGDFEDYEDAWEVAGEVCLDCVTGTWRDKRDATGAIVMRELSAWEVGLRQVASDHGVTTALALALTRNSADARYIWREDTLLPRITTA